MKYYYLCLLADSNQIGGIDLKTITIFLVNHCKFNDNLNPDIIQDMFELVTRYETKNNKTDFPDTHRHLSKSIELLCRKDFIELIIRVADIEFPKMGKIEAFKYFWTIIQQKLDPVAEYESFRD